jgi:CheY-like chemotaxis protein
MTSCVLVVDDDLDVREAVCDALQQEGYRTAEAIDGPSALQYLANSPQPSLVLLDWNMAPMNGGEFMKAMFQRHGRTIPVVLLTADGRVKEEDSRVHGFAAHLRKPVRLEALFAAVKKHAR